MVIFREDSDSCPILILIHHINEFPVRCHIECAQNGSLNLCLHYRHIARAISENSWLAENSRRFTIRDYHPPNNTDCIIIDGVHYLF